MPTPESRSARVPFKRENHVYHSKDFEELIKDAIRFFNGTPVHPLPPLDRFHGVGVYALYYTGKESPYERYGELNRLAYNFPIYVGKAVPKGWRQSRVSHNVEVNTFELLSRIREHARNIDTVSGIDLADFSCRFTIFEGPSSDMIGTFESALIKWNRPLWNSCLDGFGNHTPGAGRFEQAKSPWDVIHPGRPWADRCKGEAASREDTLRRIEEHMANIGDKIANTPKDVE